MWLTADDMCYQNTNSYKKWARIRSNINDYSDKITADKKEREVLGREKLQ